MKFQSIYWYENISKYIFEDLCRL